MMTSKQVFLAAAAAGTIFVGSSSSSSSGNNLPASFSARFHSSSLCDGNPNALNPKEFVPYKITKITQLSPNTRAFEVALPGKDDKTGMITSSFVMIKGSPDKDGKPTAKPYTPTSTNDRKGSFELVIKEYPGGVVTGHLFGKKVGDNIEVKGPINKIKYEANMKKNVACIAGGTGITPMLQVVQEILNNPADKTQVTLIFANNGEEDILLKDRIDALAKKHPSQLKVTYVVATPSASWTGEKGFCTEALLAAKLPAPSSDTLVFVCGPPGMMAAVSGNKTPDYKQGPVDGILKKLQFTEDMVFKF